MNKLKELIKSADLNIKKEMTFNIVVNSLLVISSILLLILSKNILYFLPMILLIIVFNVCSIYRYVLIKNKKDDKELNEILKIIGYLYLYINSNETVESSFTKIKTISSLKSIELINEFIANIKKKNTINFYISFANNFTSIKIDELMLSLFKYSIEKTPNNLEDVNDKINLLRNKILEIKSKKKIKHFELVKSSPLLGAVIAVLIFVVSIVLITGKYIHG